MSDITDPQERFQLIWKLFYTAEAGTYEKTSWLDLLLSEFLILLQEEDDIHERIQGICTANALVQIIICELLGGIHTIIKNFRTPDQADAQDNSAQEVAAALTRNVDDPANPPDDDSPASYFTFFTDSEILKSKNASIKKYLLKGIAWKALAVIRGIGARCLPSNRNLCGFLIWLCEELSGEGCDNQKNNPHLCDGDERLPLYELISNKFWMKERIDLTPSKNIVSHGKKLKNKHVGYQVHKFVRTPPATTITAAEQPGTSQASNVASTDSEQGSDLELLNRSLLMQPNINPEDSESQSDGASASSRPTPKQPIDDFITDRHREIMNSEISVYELHVIAIDLIYQLCQTESRGYGPQHAHVSYKCARFATKQLGGMEFQSLPIFEGNLNRIQIQHLKLMLMELFTMSLDKVLSNSIQQTTGLKIEIYPQVLTLLQGMNEAHRDMPKFNDIEAMDLAKYIFGLNYTLLIIVYCLLKEKKRMRELRGFVNSFQAFNEVRGTLFGASISKMLILSDSEETIIMVKKLLDFIMRLVSFMKRMRSELTHANSCTLLRHKECRADLMKMVHHHKDCLGAHFFLSATGESGAKCCVALLFNVFTHVMNDNRFITNIRLRTKVLKCMIKCGTCCCFSPKTLVETFVKSVQNHRDVARLSFTVLERIMFREIGAVKLYNQNDRLQCPMCERAFILSNDVAAMQNLEVARFSGNDNEFWSFLSHYSELLINESPSLVYSTMDHLLRISLICNTNIRHDLLFCVLYPSFETAKECYGRTKTNNSLFVTMSCLKLFSNMLCTVSVTDEFVNIGGLASVLDLMPNPQFSKQCCSILEIAIDVEIFKMQYKFYNEIYEGNFVVQTLSDMILSMPSLKLLVKSLEKTTDHALEYFKTKFGFDLYVNITDLSFKGCSFLFNEDSSASSSSTSQEDISIQDSSEDYTPMLKNILNFWKTCSALCLYCPIMRKYLVCQRVFRESYRLLKLTLHILCQIAPKNDENTYLLKLLEALVIIGFCASDSSVNQSKVLTMIILSDAFAFSNLEVMDNASIKALLEMLIRVSSVYINKVQVLPDIVRPRLPPFTFTSRDVEVLTSSEEEDETQYICPYGSDDSDLYVTADEGYEADVEAGALESDSISEGFASANSDIVNQVAERLKQDGILHNSRDVLNKGDAKNNYIIHPEMCNILIDVLMKLIEKIIQTNEESAASSELYTLVCQYINRLASILSIEENCTIVNDLISYIFSNPVARFLRIASKKLEELQRSLFYLIYAIANHCITPLELKSYLEIFSYSQIPTKIILEPLLKLTNNINYNVPDFIVCFPIKKSSDPSEGSDLVFESKLSSADKLVKALEKSHIEKGIDSCWSVVGSWRSIEKVGWSVWMQGFALVTWIRIQPHKSKPSESPDLFNFTSSEESGNENIPEWKYKTNRISKSKAYQARRPAEPAVAAVAADTSAVSIVHLFSVGQDSMIIEFWINTSNGKMTIKICTPSVESNVVIGQTTVASCLPLRKWFHLAMNVKDIMQNHIFCFEVKMFVNGLEEQAIVIPIEGVINRKQRSTFLLLGHAASKYNEDITLAGSWFLSELTLFRMPILNKYNVMYLIAHGPNNTSLQTCQVDKHILDFTSLYNKKVIITNVDWDQLLEMSRTDIRKLQDNLLLKYSAGHPQNVELYHQAIVHTKGTSLKGKITSGIKTTTAAIPSSMTFVWNGVPVASQYRGLPVAVYLLGGPQILLYLFARVVELGSGAEEQASALRILFKVAFSDSRLYSTFYHEEMLSMLLSVFSSPKCVMSHNFLKVMLDSACSSSILISINSKFHLLTNSSSVIVHSQILITLLKAWRSLERNARINESVAHVTADEETQNPWHRSFSRINKTNDIIVNDDKKLLDTLFLAFDIMLREDHPFRTYNIYQMNNANLLEHLLLFCKDRFAHFDVGKLNDMASHIFVKLIRTLIGATPLYHQIALIIDFLIFMHEPNLTFITHTRSNFYFLPISTSPTKENQLKALTLPFINKMKGRQDPRKTIRGGMIDPLPTNTKTIPVPVRSSTKRRPRSALFSEDTASNAPQDPSPREDNASSGSTTFTSVAQIESGGERQTRRGSSRPSQNTLLSSLITSRITEESTLSENTDDLDDQADQPDVLAQENQSDQAALGEIDHPLQQAPSHQAALGELAHPLEQAPSPSANPDEADQTNRNNDTDQALVSPAADQSDPGTTGEQANPNEQADQSDQANPDVQIEQGDQSDLDAIQVDQAVVTNPVASTSQNNVLSDYEIVGAPTVEQPQRPGVSSRDPMCQRNTDVWKNLRSSSKSGWIICEGLLILLKDTVSLMSDSLLHQVLRLLFNNNILLVLSNHKESSVRAKIIDIILALLPKYSQEEIKTLVESNYFIHLANQISQHTASKNLVAACVSLIVGRQIDSDNLLEDLYWNGVNDSDLQRSQPLVAMLNCTYHKKALFQSIVPLILKLVEKGSVKTLQDIGVCEAVLKCLKILGSVQSKSLSSYSVVFDGCKRILIEVVLKVLQSQNQQILTDLHNQLLYFELPEKCSLKVVSNVRTHKIMRSMHCHIYRAEIKYIDDKLTCFHLQVSRQMILPIAYIELTASIEPKISWCTPLRKSMMQHKTEYKPNRAELVAKRSSILNKIVKYIISRDLDLIGCETEFSLIFDVFTLLADDVMESIRQNRSRWRSSQNNIFLQNLLVELVYWAISPQMVIKLIGARILERFKSDPELKLIFETNDPTKQRKLCTYLHFASENLLTATIAETALKAWVGTWADSLKLRGHAGNTTLSDNEARKFMLLDKQEAMKTRNIVAIEKSMFCKDALVDSLTESAMSITRSVSEIQNSERKAFLDYVKQEINSSLLVAQKWRNLTDKHYHENGIWYSEKTYPQSWELNPTEGPDRVRIRLRRRHLDIEKKFFKPEIQKERESCTVAMPLSYLFESCHSHANVNDGILDRLHLNENVNFMSRATYVTITYEQEGELLLSDRCIHFVPDIRDNQTFTGTHWPLNDIINVVTRRWQLHERALEIFLSSGHAHLIAFENYAQLKVFLVSFQSAHLPNRLPFDSLSESMGYWRTGGMTNWAYLMQLNSISGRTYNDLMQYPVLPFVIADYTSEVLDLQEIQSFRNLAKPMAIQNAQQEAHYVENYRFLENAKREGLGPSSGFNREPYHYSSHYSNSGTTLHFMVRLPPFTNLFLKYQDNNLDLPDRTFHSMYTTWRLTSFDSTTDVKELIPEFYYLPEFLDNNEGLDFGVRQCGVRVEDVELPRWAPDARLFVLIHRQALESTHVKENLPNWIDLVFGYKQTGQPAIDAINVFHPATYYGYDASSLTDDLERSAWETMVRTYGQTPRQLFKQPHPHCVTDLRHIPYETIPVLRSVRGLRWGSYCGTPQEPRPVVIARKQHTVPIIRLIRLLNNEVIGIPSCMTMMLMYSNNKDSALGNPEINALGLITWGHPDGIIRIKQKKDNPPEPLIKIHSIDPLCVVAHGYGQTLSTLWLGLQSGRIIVLTATPLASTTAKFDFSRKPINLYGHHAQIVDISVCVPFGVAASASCDGVVNIWDAFSFTHIRSLVRKIPTISCLCISETLCDVATVHLKVYDNSAKIDIAETKMTANRRTGSIYDDPYEDSTRKCKSKIRVSTINGMLVGEVKIVEQVNCICYSNAQEGISVNVIVVGLETGSIRLFSSWDLKPLRCLTPVAPIHPIVSLAYSQNSQHLYAAASDGTVLLWENPSSNIKESNFRVLTAASII
ncbi:lysosomal-trafficking regulator mauve [Arctopsyche grandis]|uniref:lysosomal-trafficking regulator mauve n=1 Tax=Arctopsyche grandis TaxID=121162 RepID=UPI00406D8ACC